MSYEKSFQAIKEEKIAYLNNVFSESLYTIEITDYVNLKDRNDEFLLDALGRHITEHNKVDNSDPNYFIFNDKTRIKKRAILQELMMPDSYKKYVQSIGDTSGRLFLTIDPEWFRLCSDKNFVSWNSCFSPDGCYHLVPYEFSTSISIMMAMITNSDMTRIIGRKWVVIPYRKDRSGEKEKIVKVPEILCLKSYGTFPVTYQQAVSRWIIENIFEDEKDNWKVYEYSKDSDTLMGLEMKILVESHDGGGYYSYLSSKPDRLKVKIYMDNSSYILIPKSLALSEVPEGRVTFYGLDEDEEDEVSYHELEDSNEDEDYDDDEHWECANCGERIDHDTSYEMFFSDCDHDYDTYCEDCVNELAIFDPMLDRYLEKEWFEEHREPFYMVYSHYRGHQEIRDIVSLEYTIENTINYPNLYFVDPNDESKVIYETKLYIRDAQIEPFLKKFEGLVRKENDDYIVKFNVQAAIHFVGLSKLTGVTFEEEMDEIIANAPTLAERRNEDE